ncbi:MAG: sensor histidine kinase [Planctomycetaceae bacterium]
MKLAVERTGAERAVLVMKSARGEPEVVTAWSCEGVDLSADNTDISWATVSNVLETNTGCVFSDALSDEELTSHRSIAGLQLRSLLCVPLRAEGLAEGVLYLDHRHIAGLFGEAERGLVELVVAAIAQLHAVAAAKARRREAEAAYKEAIEQLLRTERHRVVAELSAGLAHDVKNLMAAVVARAQFLRASLGDSPMVAGLKAIEKAAATGARMIGSLQDCVREEVGEENVPIDLGLIAHEALELLGPRLAAGVRSSESHGSIDLVRHIELGVCVRGHPGEIRQLLLNLLINACDAMPGGGKLTVLVKRDDGGSCAYVSVRDTGTGMPDSIRKRIFEPFYTTKGKHGTGLGLAVVQSVVLKLGGAISVETAVGVGTAFIVTVPLALGLRAT